MNQHPTPRRLPAAVSLRLGAALALAGTLALGAVPAPAAAQEPVDAAMIERIRTEGMEHSGAWDTYQTLTDVMGPRLTGSPGYLRAAEWARNRLADWGAAHAHLEPFEFGRGWTLEGLTLEMTAPRYFPLTGYPEAWTPSTDGTLEGEVVYLAERTLEEIRALADAGELRNAIVMAEGPQPGFLDADRQQPADMDSAIIAQPRPPRAPSTASLREVLPLLTDAGAGVLLRPNAGRHGTVFVVGGRNTDADAVPEVVLAAEHYNMLARLAAGGHAPRVRVHVDAAYNTENADGYNVLAEIPGTDPEVGHEVVMLGGHLDSWHASNGAMDNADGATAALEAMRILLALDAKPRRTIRVALWGGEEQGLLGARAWVAEHLAGDDDGAAQDAFSVYLNDDPGAGATYGFYMEENGPAKEIFDAWIPPLVPLGARRNVFEGIGSTDHLAFTAQGLPAFTTLKDYTFYDQVSRHGNMDFAERVTAEALQESAIVLAVAAWHAAQRDGLIPRAPGG